MSAKELYDVQKETNKQTEILSNFPWDISEQC